MAPKVTVPEVRSRKRARGGAAPGHAHRLRHPRGAHRRRRRGRHDPGGRLGGQHRARPRRHPAGRRGSHGPSRRRCGPGRRPGPGGGGHAVAQLPRVGARTPSATPPRWSGPGAQAVKLEGGRARVPMVEALVATEIPVMGHLGLTPQSVHAMGGYKVQARQAAAAEALLSTTPRPWPPPGASPWFSRASPTWWPARVTDEVDVPTIGIGAGAGCDGQVLVFHDLLGLGGARSPSSSASTPTWPPWPSRRCRRGPPTSARGTSRPTPRPTTCRPSRPPGDPDPPFGYHGRRPRTGSPPARPGIGCTLLRRGGAPVAEWRRVQREVSRACGRTRR